MIYTKNKLIILINLMLLMSFISISSKNLISLWYYMEIASFIFIFYLMKMNNPMKSSILYFIISFISTIMIFSSIIIMNFNTMEMNLMMEKSMINSSMLTFAFILKMGSIPFHFWVFKMTENMEWTSLMILFSIQKMIPIWAISCFSKSLILLMFIFISVIMGPTLPLKSKNSFFLLATSSIINNIWIILASACSLMTSIMYTLTYFIINTNFIFALKKTNSKSISTANSIQIMISILSLMGFPPLPNFFIKLMVLKNLLSISSNLLFMAIIILISNMISSIMYMKFILLPIVNFKNLFVLLNYKTNKNMMNLLSNFGPFLFLISFMFN